jgi:hypothetical protein
MGTYRMVGYVFISVCHEANRCWGTMTKLADPVFGKDEISCEKKYLVECVDNSEVVRGDGARGAAKYSIMHLVLPVPA